MSLRSLRRCTVESWEFASLHMFGGFGEDQHLCGRGGGGDGGGAAVVVCGTRGRYSGFIRFTLTANTLGKGVGLHHRHPQSPIRIFRALTSRAQLGYRERLGRQPRIYFFFLQMWLRLASTLPGNVESSWWAPAPPVCRSCALWVWAE